ncbi:hypothetical protein P879_01100 [Paragonimus westermani]|uniref:Tetraspanin n=1 Tax=Paragonimus westermani TaxID=34504 RepID=A0A8T0DXU0_9TREM|nr:hypothetical protein P879_01100 [Paragonimus westermani]
MEITEPAICTAYNIIRIIGNILCFLIVCFGAALSGTSTYVLVMQEYMAEVFGRYLFYGSLYTILGCGIFTVLIGFVGFYEFTHENRFTAILTAVGISCLVLVVFIVGIILFQFPRTMRTNVLNAMTKSLPDYGQNSPVTKAWDNMQSFLRCCAIRNLGWEDYKKTEWFKQTNTDVHDKDSSILFVTNPFYQSVPVSCCVTLIDSITGYPTTQYRDQQRCQHWEYGPPLYTSGPHNDALYYRGCFNTLVDYMMLHSKHLFTICLALCFFLVITFVVLITGKLIKPVRRRKKRI